MQLEDIEGEPARHEPVAVADARCAHPYWPRKLAQGVEEDVVDDMAQEVSGELGRAAGVSCGAIPGLRDGGRGFYPACVLLTESEAIANRLPRLRPGALIPITAMVASLVLFVRSVVLLDC